MLNATLQMLNIFPNSMKRGSHLLFKNHHRKTRQNLLREIRQHLCKFSRIHKQEK